MMPLDLELVTYTTAVQAIWRLYRNGKWSCLEELGMQRSLYLNRLERFDLLFLDDDDAITRCSTIGNFSKRVPERSLQVKEFLRVIPHAARICETLLVRYIKTEQGAIPPCPKSIVSSSHPIA
jgi:hypothetical protein